MKRFKGTEQQQQRQQKNSDPLKWIHIMENCIKVNLDCKIASMKQRTSIAKLNIE